nr:MAG TPA: hypothetical protein [Caudoviricetes sp.]
MIKDNHGEDGLYKFHPLHIIFSLKSILLCAKHTVSLVNAKFNKIR